MSTQTLPEVEAAPRVQRVALAGNPNVGKTSVFNLLTGMRHKVANYPGVTVERRIGRLVGAQGVEVIDLPGTYSLNPKSLDERVAFDVLVGRMDGEAPPDVVVCVVDATNLERNLFLATQILDLGLPVVVALNMMDAAEEAGLQIDTDALSRKLGAPVAPIVARKGKGVDALRKAIQETPAPLPRRWSLMPAVEPAVERLAKILEKEVPRVAEQRRFSEALGALTSDPLLAAWKNEAPKFHQAVMDARNELTERNVPFRQAETMGRYGWISPLIADVVTRRKDPSERTTSDRLDAVLTHRVAGPIIFIGILALIFQAVFTWAVPAMDLIEAGVVGLGQLTRDILPNGPVEDMLVEGVITGVGNVIIFLPQILLLFFFLGLMEDTGYMARTAFIMDRFMRRLGLSGGSVVPLLSAYACAIPAIMAARTLDNERHRLITIMVAPLMTCSARLPVYTLFIAAFIPAGALLGIFGYQGLAMLSLYLLGTVMAFVAAYVLKKIVFKEAESSTFVMELPPYRAPQIKQVALRMVERSRIFIIRAGRIIFGLSILLWFLASYPNVEPSPELQAREQAVEARYDAVLDSTAAAEGITVGELVARAPMNAVNRADNVRLEQLEAINDAQAGYQMRHSFLGVLGHTLEPIVRPLGFDWKIAAALVAAQAAREVIVGALATIYGAGSADEVISLQEALKQDRYPNGEPVYTPLVAVSLMIYFVFALQCMSTVAIARRETNSWKWPVVMWVYMTGLGYIASLIVYQGGQALGLG